MKRLLLANLLTVFLNLTFANLINIVKQVKDEVASHPRLTIYTYKNENSQPSAAFIMRNLLDQIPSVIIDLTDIPKHKSSHYESFPYNHMLILASMHIILVEENRFNQFLEHNLMT